MAIWTTTIEILNLDRSEAKLTGVFDDELGNADSVRTYSAVGPMSNTIEKKAVADRLIAQLKDYDAQKPLIAAKIAELELDAKTYLEANDGQ